MISVPVLPLAIGDSSGAVLATAAESNMLLGFSILVEFDQPKKPFWLTLRLLLEKYKSGGC